MAYAIKNSLFVRNLSPQVTEAILREVFDGCDEIEKIVFRPYPNSSSQFFAEIDFRTSKGVAEGSKLSGTSILGVPCVCGVIDPIALAAQEQARALAGPGGDALSLLDPEAIQAQYLKQEQEAAEDQRLRTVHIAGLAHDVTPDGLRLLCKNFGDVANLRIDTDGQGATFALVEFSERGPAQVAKMQRQFLVDGRILIFTEAKTFVDATSFAERTVHFQAPILDAFNMRHVLAQQGQLSAKLAQVRAAAREILGEKEEPAENREDHKEKKPKKDKKDKKDKEEKEKRDKKDKKKKEKREKDDRSQRPGGRSKSATREKGGGDGKRHHKKEKEDKEGSYKRAKDREARQKKDKEDIKRKKGDLEKEKGGSRDDHDRKVRKQRRNDAQKRESNEEGSGGKSLSGDHDEARKEQGQASEEPENEAPPMVQEGSGESSSDDDSTIELDSEVEMVANTELLVLRSSSSSSSSSSSASERGVSPDREAAVSGRPPLASAGGALDAIDSIDIDDADDVPDEAVDVEGDLDLQVERADIRRRPPPATVRRRPLAFPRSVPPRLRPLAPVLLG